MRQFIITPSWRPHSLIKTAALYLRISTSDKGQTTDNQRLVLEGIARRHGWEITHVFEDEVSGTKGRDQRPAFHELMQCVVRKDFDIILVWAVDRLSRSLQDLIAFLTDIQQKKVHLYVHQSALDTSTPHGTMMFQLLGIFSQFEASMIRSRVMAGLDRAKAQGKRLGRPSLAPIEVKQIAISLNKGLSIRKAAKRHGVSTATIMRIKQQAHTAMMAPTEAAPSPISG